MYDGSTIVNVRSDVRFTAVAVFVVLIALIHCGGGNPPEADIGPLPLVDLSTLDPDLADRLTKSITNLRSEPENAAFNGDAAMMLHAYQQFELAVQFYRRAQALEPANLHWRYYQGEIHARQGRYDEAIASFNSVLEIDTTFVPAKKRLARALLDYRKLDESLRIYRALVANEPNDAEIRNGLGRLHAALGNSEDAVVHLTRAVEILPNYGEAHYALALAYHDLGDEENAANHLQRYEADKFSAPTGSDLLMTAVSSLNISAVEYLKAGVEAEEAGRIPEAIDHHLQALQLDPTLYPAHVNLVLLYATNGEPDHAEFHYQKALALDPNSATLHYYYGMLWFDQGNYNQAAASFQRALEINPNHAFANHDLGQLHEQAGRLDDAIRYYRRAVANRPDYGLAHFNLGRTMMKKDRLGDAIREFQLALREETSLTPICLATLASAYARLGKTSEAADTFKLARQAAERHGQDALAEEIDNEINRLAAYGAR
jgi:tetratricopeptide (TPR) repeat protein